MRDMKKTKLTADEKAQRAEEYDNVDDRPNGATHVRRNGATLKWQN